MVRENREEVAPGDAAASGRWWSLHLVCGSDPGKGNLGLGREGGP